MPLRFLVPPSLGAARANARAELLATALTSELGTEVKVDVAPTYGDLLQQAIEHQAELLWAPAAVCAQIPPPRVILRTVRRGRRTYRSAIIARKDKGLTVKTLRGMRAAWVDPLSAGGYLLPCAYLWRQGIDPNLVFDTQSFLGSHLSAVESVVHGEADVTAVSTPGEEPDVVETAIQWYAGRYGDQLHALAITDTCPNDALVITERLPESDAEALAARLAPTDRKARAPSFLLSAMESEKLERTSLDDYREIKSLMWGRSSRSERPSRY